ncbi:MAG: pitrilysin family protein [Hydrogenothermaceae bacterium]
MIANIAQAEELYVKKLKNGYTLVVKERDDTQTVSVQVWFSIGSIYEKDNERGISHFLEHMLFNGTKYTAPGEIEFEVEKKGGMINAATSFDYTFYYIEIASVFWQDALKYLYYMTTAPTLSDKMVEKEKPIVLEELNRHLDDPKSLLWDTYNELAYKKSNYKYPIIGFKDTIQNFTGELVRNYFFSHYTPSVATIVIVGNVNKKEVEKAVEETFGTVKGQDYHPPPVPLEDPQREVISKTLKKPQVTRAYSVVGWQAPSIRDKKAIALMVLEDILFGGKSSIMYQQLKETGIVQGITGGYIPHIGTGQFLIYITTDINKREIAKEKVFDILNKFRKEGIPENLFEESKKRIINREIFEREEVSEEAERIGYALSVVGNLDYELKFIDMVKSVKKEEVEDFLKNHFREDNYTEVILLPEN